MARANSHRPFRQQSSSLEQIVALTDRPERERSGLFWAEGCRSFFSALESRWPVETVVYCPKILHSGAAWDALRQLSRQFRVLRLTAPEFQTVTRRLEPDGIGVVCRQRWRPLIQEEPRAGNVWVALDSVRTPGNFGTILRTCSAVGVRGVMLIGGEVDPFDPAAIRASMGAIFSTPLIRTSARALAGWKLRRSESVHFVGTSPAAQLDYRRATYLPPLVLMMGSERSGLRERQLSLCDEVVRLPMTGSVDSLNLAVATSIVLYEATREFTRDRPHLGKASSWPGAP